MSPRGETRSNDGARSSGRRKTTAPGGSNKRAVAERGGPRCADAVRSVPREAAIPGGGATGIRRRGSKTKRLLARPLSCPLRPPNAHGCLSCVREGGPKRSNGMLFRGKRGGHYYTVNNDLPSTREIRAVVCPAHGEQTANHRPGSSSRAKMKHGDPPQKITLQRGCTRWSGFGRASFDFDPRKKKVVI